MDAKTILDKIKDGIDGNNPCILTKFGQLAVDINYIEPGQSYLISGQSKSYKTKFTDTYFILNALLANNMEYLHENYIVTYFSFEETKENKILDWLSFFLFNIYKIKLSKNKLLSKNNMKLNPKYLPIIEECLSKYVLPIIDPKTGFVHIIEERANSDKIANHLKNIAPNHPNKVKLVIIDHIRLIKKTALNVKQNMDDFGILEIELRNKYGYSFVDIQHLNRSISDQTRVQTKNLRPTKDDLKDSGNTSENCTIHIAVFNPYNYPNIEIHFGYKLSQYYKTYRSIHLIEARNYESPKDYFFVVDGGNNLFVNLPPPDHQDLDKFNTNWAGYLNRQY